MNCARIALERAGIPVTKYYSSEIDKYANIVTQANHPDTIQIGDVTKVKASDLDMIDLIIGGSPCQGFSFAGKQLNFDDPRSMLFFEYVRLRNEIDELRAAIGLPPVIFLLENVRMKVEYSRVISQFLGVSPVRINSSLLSAQNRDRFYWTNIPYFLPPEDKGIMLRDIIHENTDGMDIEKYKVTPTKAFRLLDAELAKRKIALIHEKDTQSSRVYSIHGKAICLSGAGGGGAVNMGQYLIQEPHGASVGGIIDSDKSPALLASRHGASNTLLMNVDAIGLNGLDRPNSQTSGPRFVAKGKANSVPTRHDRNGVLVNAEIVQEKRGFNDGGRFAKKTPTLTSNDWPNNNVMEVFGCTSPDREEKRQNGQRFSDGAKANTLTAQDRHGILAGGYIRKLTPIEAERLQTVDDNFTAHVSDSQRYRMLGNGFTVDVIAYILKGIHE